MNVEKNKVTYVKMAKLPMVTTSSQHTGLVSFKFYKK